MSRYSSSPDPWYGGRESDQPLHCAEALYLRREFVLIPDSDSSIPCVVTRGGGFQVKSWDGKYILNPLTPGIYIGPLLGEI